MMHIAVRDVALTCSALCYSSLSPTGGSFIMSSFTVPQLRGTYIFECFVNSLCHASNVVMAIFLRMFWKTTISFMKK